MGAEAPASMEDLLLLLVDTNPQQQPALLPTSETEEAPVKQFSLSKLPQVVMGRDAAGEYEGYGFCQLLSFCKGCTALGEKFTGVSRCGETQIAKYLGGRREKSTQFWSHSFPQSFF